MSTSLAYIREVTSVAFQLMNTTTCVRAYCYYGVSDVKCYELCCWYDCDCEVCVAEKIGYFTYYHGVIISKCEK